MGTSQQFDAVAFLQSLYTPGGDTSGLTDPAEPDLHPTITPAELPPEWREHYEERAAIREFDGGQAQEHAEAEALRETLEAMRAADLQSGEL